MEWIQSYVSPVPKRLLEGSDGVKVIHGSERRIIWVPKRQSLKHAVFSLPKQLRGRKLTSALDLKVQAWAPFASPGYAVMWRENQASVIAWDQISIERRMTEHGYSPTQCEVIPEVFMRQPINDGVRLIEVNDGIEAQAWKGGFLSMTRWWHNLPDQGEWSLFARSIGPQQGDTGYARPDMSHAEWLETPWNSTLRNKNLFSQIIVNREFVTALATILIAPCLYFSTEWVAFSLLNSSMESETTELELGSKSVRNERRRAIESLEYAESLASLSTYPRQIEIISRAHTLLQPFDIQISGWDYDEGILEFGLKSENAMNATLYIPPFEEDPMFSRVSASTRGQRLVMRMDVTRNKDLPS